MTWEIINAEIFHISPYWKVCIVNQPQMIKLVSFHSFVKSGTRHRTFVLIVSSSPSYTCVSFWCDVCCVPVLVLLFAAIQVICTLSENRLTCCAVLALQEMACQNTLFLKASWPPMTIKSEATRKSCDVSHTLHPTCLKRFLMLTNDWRSGQLLFTSL